MNWLSVQTVAEISVERILNALPEGLLIAFFAWALLRVLRKQNSGTRFAVWFLALIAVAALPVCGGFRFGLFGGAGIRPAISVPSHWALFVFAFWVAGSSIAIARLLTGLWRLRKLRQSCTPIIAADLDPWVQKTVEAIGASKLSKSRSSKSITVATSDQVRVPAAIGFWNRTIVLPAWALRELPPHDLSVILLHEFAHLRRGDDWTNLIQKIVRALFFFHPAVWWIENRLSVEREMACDDAVLAETANPLGYATCLISLLEKSLAQRGWSMAQAAVHRAHEASLRLSQILDAHRPVATRVWKPALGMVGAFSMVCLMALPRLPQFVAFDRGGMVNHSDYLYSAAIPPTSLPTSVNIKSAAVVPASFRMGESSASGSSLATSLKVVSAPVRAHRITQRALTPARKLAARPNLPQLREVMQNAGASRKNEPEVRALFFIETTRYVIDDSAVWSVQVWRVTLLSPDWRRLAKVPVANSI
jgi:beta-lactamase regulating signal transducer with metallopeptidase domain